MMETTIGKKVEQLLNSEDFIAIVKDCNSLEDIRQAFANEGVQMNDEQFAMLLDAIKEAANNAPEGELAENDLDNVAGGASAESVVKWMIGAFKWGWKMGERFYKWEQSLYK